MTDAARTAHGGHIVTKFEPPAGSLPMTGAIFDIDGTLFDSMPIWYDISDIYLTSKGKTPGPTVFDDISTLSLPESAAYFQQNYGITDSVDTICDEINGLIYNYYAHEAPLKPGAREFLEMLVAQDVRICVATATDRRLVEAALDNQGVAGFISFVTSCSDIGYGKERPDVFLAALERLGTPKESTWVFEDAYHAVVTAHQAGFPVAGIADAWMEEMTDQLRNAADAYMSTFGDWGKRN